MKRLPIHFVKSCGLSEFTFDHKPAVRVPYLGVDGEELAVRFRIALDGDRFRWKSGPKPCLYGLHRLHEAHEARQVVLVEGESDCHTLWFHEIPTLGIPGATNWREERDARYLDGIETIYVVIEPVAIAFHYPAAAKAGRFRSDLPLIGILQFPPSVHMLPKFIDDRSRVILLIFR